MPGKFILRNDVKRDELEIARLSWLSNPASTGAKHLTVIEGTFLSGKGHSFHDHADQAELIYVVSGTLDHWIEQEKRTLSPGDSVFMPAGIVHATFNTGIGGCEVHCHSGTQRWRDRGRADRCAQRSTVERVESQRCLRAAAGP